MMITKIFILLTIVQYASFIQATSYLEQKLELNEKGNKTVTKSKISPLEKNTLKITPTKNDSIEFYKKNHPDSSFFFYPFHREFFISGGGLNQLNDDNNNLMGGLGYRELFQNSQFYVNLNGTLNGKGYTQIAYAYNIFDNYIYKMYISGGMNIYIEGKNQFSSFISYDHYLLSLGLGAKSHFFTDWLSLALEAHLAQGTKFQFAILQLYIQRGF